MFLSTRTLLIHTVKNPFLVSSTYLLAPYVCTCAEREYSISGRIPDPRPKVFFYCAVDRQVLNRSLWAASIYIHILLCIYYSLEFAFLPACLIEPCRREGGRVGGPRPRPFKKNYRILYFLYRAIHGDFCWHIYTVY